MGEGRYPNGRVAGIALLLFSAVALVACGGRGSSSASAPTPPAQWQVPTCNTVSGTRNITFTSDDGVVRTPSALPIRAHDFTFGLAVLEIANTLLAVVQMSDAIYPEVLRSTDAGCTWSAVGQTLDDRMRLTAAGTRAYAWLYGRNFIYDVSDAGAATRIDTAFPLMGLGVDPTNPNRIRTARRTTDSWQLMQSTDRGRSWSSIGTAAADANPQSVAAFSPVNLDHAIVLSSSVGAQVTLDGGNQWITSQGFLANGQPNGRMASIGPDGQTVWLLLQDSVFESGQVAEPKAIYLSTDGGINFQRVVIATSEHMFSSGGTTFYPHVSNPDVMYFAYGGAVSTGLSYLYRYDASFSRLAIQTWPYGEGEVKPIAFNPVDDQVLYLGLSRNDIVEP